MLKEKIERWLSRTVNPRSSGSTGKDAVVIYTDTGFKREENQDRVACMKVYHEQSNLKSFIVIALSDGMGGMRDGAKCASIAISAFFDEIIKIENELTSTRLLLAANAANEEVHKFSNGYGGATLSAVLITSDLECTTLNIGDSRIYYQPETLNMPIRRLTVDDSLAEAVGGTNKDLIQFVGMGYGLQPHIKPAPYNIERLLITSDGVHFISHQTLDDLVKNSFDLTQLANRLLTVVRWSGAPDNASLALISPKNLEFLFKEKNQSHIEIWDSFSETHFLDTESKEELTRTPLNKDSSRSSTVKTDRPKIEKKQSTSLKPLAKAAKKRRTTKKKDEANENLQIVIDMDSTRTESLDDNSH